MKIGYARVSTADQNLDLHKDALEKVGCKNIFKETVNGVRKDRPEFAKMMATLREGYTLVVWK